MAHFIVKHFFWRCTLEAIYKKTSEELRREFSKNLKTQREKMGHVSIKKIASVCHVSSTTAERWFKGSSLPDLPNLYMLADFFGCSVYSLLEPADDETFYLLRQPVHLSTYADVFHYLLRLYSSPYINFQSPTQLTDVITNPITKFLIDSFFKNLDLVRHAGVSSSELQAWIKKVSEDFSLPISPASPKRINEILSQNRTLDLYSDYLRTATYLYDHMAEEQIEDAERQEDINYELLSGLRIPSPDEFKRYPDFYGSPEDYDL